METNKLTEDKNNEEIVDIENNSDNNEKIELIDIIEERRNKRAEKLASQKECLVLLLCIAIVAGVTLSTIFFVLKIQRSNIKNSHIYVCESAENFSDVDTWIHDELGIHWVPTFLVFQNGKYMGSIEGTIGVEDFKSSLGTQLLLNAEKDVPTDLEITNIDGKSEKLVDIVSKHDLCFIEVAWIDCIDCKNQEPLNKGIYIRYNANNFYIYYMKSDLNDVLEHYK